MAQDKDNLIWIDLEMTGLDSDNDGIIEIATIVTDKELRVLEEGPVMAIHQTDEVLKGMDEWNTRHHQNSGLTERVRKSSLTYEDAEQATIDFLRRHVDKGVSPMCGNSICQDRRFMHRCMPKLETYFHYRNLDVSSIKELQSRWGDESNEFNKESSHLAIEDVRDSIDELRYYREHIFKF